MPRGVWHPCGELLIWKRLKGKNTEGKNFRRLLRRKQSSAKILKIARNILSKSSKSDIFYLLRNLLKYLLRTFFSSAKFSEVFTLCVFTLWLFPTNLPEKVPHDMGISRDMGPLIRCPSVRSPSSPNFGNRREPSDEAMSTLCH